MPNDTLAKKQAAKIVEEFWVEFERALAPTKATKAAYCKALEELAADVEGRLGCVRDEMESE